MGALGCPVEGCTTMEEIPTGKPSMSWSQYQKVLAEGKIEKLKPKKTGATLT
jgi:hypothetical protein